MSEISSTNASNVQRNSSDSTFSLSSGPLDEVPSSMISSKFNENNNVDIPSTDGVKMSRRSPAVTEEESALESNEEKGFSERNLSSNVISGNDQIYGDENNSQSNCTVKSGNTPDFSADSRSNHYCVTLTVKDVESSENKNIKAQ